MDTANTFPKGTTHVRFGAAYRFTNSFTASGNPEFVRWIKSRNDWAVAPRAFPITDSHKI